MAILSCVPMTVGAVGVNPRQWNILTDNTFAQVTAPGFLTNYQSRYNFLSTDYAEVYTTDAATLQFSINVAANGVVSLVNKNASSLAGLSADQAVVTDSGKNLVSAPYSSTPAASNIARWDSNANFSANRFIPLSNTQSLSATKTLVAADPQYQFLNPNGADRLVTLPVGVTGMLFVIKNIGTAGNILTVQDSSSVQVGNPLSNTICSGYFYDGTAWRTV